MFKKEIYLAIFMVLMSPHFTTFTFASDDPLTFEKYIEKANAYIKEYRHFEACEALKEATKLSGKQHPVLHMRLGILYYGLGLIPEAIAEGEKAVSLEPTSKWYKYDLAKFYFVNKKLAQAEQQIFNLLELDPGFSHGYYYLAEMYYQKKEYMHSWLSLQRASQLGFQGRELEKKLDSVSKRPKESVAFSQSDDRLYRFLTLSTGREAEQRLDQLSRGQLFENIELELNNKQIGGINFGLLMESELSDEVAKSLQDAKPYSPPLIIKTGSEYRIMQRILPFDRKSWENTLDKSLNQVLASSTETLERSRKPPVRSVASGSESDEISSVQDGNHPGQDEALEAIDTWKRAWERQDIKAYFQAYSADFSPSGKLTREAWQKRRIRSLSRPSFIHLDITILSVESLSNDELLFTFKQRYKSDNYSDIVIKSLTMKKENQGWKIAMEKEIEKVGS